jgi:hypothetical protein
MNEELPQEYLEEFALYVLADVDCFFVFDPAAILPP